MYFLLVNNNPAVSRLITLSVEKLGFDIDEVSSFDETIKESYDIVLVDNEEYSEVTIDENIKEGLSCNFVYIAKKGEKKPENMSTILEKPFLPTDFIDLVAKIDSDSNEESLDIGEEDVVTNKAVDLDLEESLDLIEIDFEEDNDLSLDDNKSKDDEELGLDEEMLKENEKENEEESTSDDDKEELTSVLDSDDIDEVKQLLEDENNEKELENFDTNEFENKLDEEDIGDLTTALKELDKPKEEKLASEDFASDKLEKNLDSNGAEELEEVIAPLSEDNIKNLVEEQNNKDEVNAEDSLEDKLENNKEEEFKDDDLDISDLEDAMDSIEIEEDLSLDEDDEMKEVIAPLEKSLDDKSVEDLKTTLDTLISENSKISSIDELDEDILLDALGIENANSDVEESKEEITEDQNIKDEIEEKVSQSVKEALKDSFIRDALKGMKVNISISFNEDEL